MNELFIQINIKNAACCWIISLPWLRQNAVNRSNACKINSSLWPHDE